MLTKYPKCFPSECSANSLICGPREYKVRDFEIMKDAIIVIAILVAIGFAVFGGGGIVGWMLVLMIIGALVL